MTTGDDQILAQLRTDFGADWTISRTGPWWKATRHQQLTFREMEKGLDQTLLVDTAHLLRTGLAKQADLAETLTV